MPPPLFFTCSKANQRSLKTFLFFGFKKFTRQREKCVCGTILFRPVHRPTPAITTTTTTTRGEGLCDTLGDSNKRTCDGYFGGPLARPVQNGLLDGFHVTDMTALFNSKHGPKYSFVDGLFGLGFFLKTESHVSLISFYQVLPRH